MCSSTPGPYVDACRRSADLPQKREEDALPLGDVEHLLVVAGNSDEDNPYRKGSALQVRTAPAPSRHCLTDR